MYFGKDPGKVCARGEGLALDVGLCVSRFDAIEKSGIRRPADANHLPQHSGRIFFGKERRPAEHFRHDATAAPKVERVRVVRPVQHHFRRAVPSGADVTGHLFGQFARKAEVEDAQIALFRKRNVRRRQIAVDYAGRVDVTQCAQDLETFKTT